jgi:DNA-binding CsgD family transcriptional regulator
MILRSYYGLTRSEIRLCQAMLGGKSLIQAAASASISRNTAKTHLSRVFDKMGVTSQAALLRLLAKGTRPKVTEP